MKKLILILIAVGIHCFVNAQTGTSAEMLKSFYLLEVSMQNAGKNLDEANIKLLGALDRDVQKQGDKAIPFAQQAHVAKEIADRFVLYIESIKTEILSNDETVINHPRNEDGQLMNPGNMQLATHYFLENNATPDEKANGRELISKINTCRYDLFALIDLEGQNNVKSDLRFQESSLEETFRMPLASVFAILTKFQLDAKKTETDVINYLSTQINATDFKFDALVTTINAASASVPSGSVYTADIILTAYNSKQRNDVYVDGVKIEVVDGKATYKVRANGEGKKTYKAAIKLVDPKTGVLTDYVAEGEYQVFTPNATISASKTSVFYAGIDNPVAISVPGYRDDQVHATCENGTLVGALGQYHVKVVLGQVRMAKITVVATGDDQVSKSFHKEFKIYPLPSLAVTVNGKEGGSITNAEIQLLKFVNASFGPSFPYDGLSYTVSRFHCEIHSAGATKKYEVLGNQISPELKAALLNGKKGDHIVFYDIDAESTSAPNKFIISGPHFTIN